MNIVLVEFTTVNKGGRERFTLPLQDVCLLGESKKGCCIVANDGSVYDALNVYDDVKKVLADAGVAVISLPVPSE